MGTQTHPQKRPRILALDLIRGGFLIAIIVDHLNWGPSLWHILTGGGQMWVSPAEGFFAISGLLVGYIYGPHMARSFMSAAKKLWRRAGLLYILAVVFTFAYTGAALLFATDALPPTWPRDTVSFVYNTFLMRYAYGWTDFLPRYAVFMAVAPFALWLVTRGYTWLVAGSSIAAWALLHTNPYFLPFSAWQLVFFLGMIAGYHLPALQSAARQLPWIVRRTSVATLWSIAIISFTLSSICFVVLPILGYSNPLAHFMHTAAPIFDKETLGIGRLFIGTVWFWALYTFVRRYEQQISHACRGALETFGTKSLYTYGVHGFIIFMFVALVPVPSTPSILDSTALGLLVVALIYLLIIWPYLGKWLSMAHYRHHTIKLLQRTGLYES